MSPKRTSAIPPEARTLVVELWQQGLDMKAIGTKLGVSRGTVAGVVYRMRKSGIAIPSRKREDVEPEASAELVVFDQSIRAETGEFPDVKVPRLKKSSPSPLFEPTNPAWQALDVSRPVNILDAGRHSCRWPIGPSNDRLVCGADTRDMPSVYCKHHHNLAYTIPPKPEGKSVPIQRTAWSKRVKQ